MPRYAVVGGIAALGVDHPHYLARLRIQYSQFAVQRTGIDEPVGEKRR